MTEKKRRRTMNDVTKLTFDFFVPNITHERHGSVCAVSIRFVFGSHVPVCTIHTLHNPSRALSALSPACSRWFKIFRSKSFSGSHEQHEQDCLSCFGPTSADTKTANVLGCLLSMKASVRAAFNWFCKIGRSHNLFVASKPLSKQV